MYVYMYEYMYIFKIIRVIARSDKKNVYFRMSVALYVSMRMYEFIFMINLSKIWLTYQDNGTDCVAKLKDQNKTENKLR